MNRTLPQARYVLPSFIERTSYGVKESNPYNKLFEERIIFLGVQIDAPPHDAMARMLVLESRPLTATSCTHSPVVFTSLMATTHDAYVVRISRNGWASGRRFGAAVCSPPVRGQADSGPNARILIHQRHQGVTAGLGPGIQGAGSSGCVAAGGNLGPHRQRPAYPRRLSTRQDLDPRGQGLRDNCESTQIGSFRGSNLTRPRHAELATPLRPAKSGG